MVRLSLPGSPRRPGLSSYINNISPWGRVKQNAWIRGISGGGIWQDNLRLPEGGGEVGYFARKADPTDVVPGGGIELK